MGGQDAHHGLLEFGHHFRSNGFFVDAFFFGDRAHQRPALIHCGGRDHPALIGDGLHALLLTCADFHRNPSEFNVGILARDGARTNGTNRMELLK